jgi:uncharacterized protein YfaQ (DUF2300 family)
MKTSLNIRKLWLINLIVGIVFMPAIASGLEPNIDQNDFNLATLNKDGLFSVYAAKSKNWIEKEYSQELKTPLGSLWKLFLYIFLVENQITPEPYKCTGSDPKEIFCCKPQKRIDIDQALIKSCGLFFEKVRSDILKNNHDVWRLFWRNEVGLKYGWLTNLNGLRPGEIVNVKEILTSLLKTNKLSHATLRSREVLPEVLISGTAKGAVRLLGSSLKVKTFTWDDPDRIGKFVGGFAGWLNDGSAIWALGKGKGSQVINLRGRQINQKFFGRLNSFSSNCVRVKFFDRYPISKIVNQKTKQLSSEGPLEGDHQIFFKNGNTLKFYSTGGLHYKRSKNEISVMGLFNINEYVARVLEREISVNPKEAAKAFAILTRTYLINRAQFTDKCFVIPDSSRYQRVSIHNPSDSSLVISNWTDGLILTNINNIQYHSTTKSHNRISWTFAKKLAKDNLFFDEILKIGYPTGILSVMKSKLSQNCRRLPLIENWLHHRSALWGNRLKMKVGYESPDRVVVCELTLGNPFSDLENNRIFVKSIKTRNDKITIAHEFLHISFKNHPLGNDENFIEKTAIKLVSDIGGSYEN